MIRIELRILLKLSNSVGRNIESKVVKMPYSKLYCMLLEVRSRDCNIILIDYLEEYLFALLLNVISSALDLSSPFFVQGIIKFI